MKKIISIEGNIGSGKSTIIERLKNSNLPFIYLPEPVDVWNEIKDSNGTTILENYYNNIKRYSFSFQMMAYITRLSQIRTQLKNSPDDCIIITERCLYTDRFVFAKMLYDSGNIDNIEYSIYLKWFDEFIDILNPGNKFYVNKMIYIKTTPEICLERTKIRNRQGEQDMPLDYLTSCNNYHTDFINEVSIPKLILDGNEKIELETIINFINNTCIL